MPSNSTHRILARGQMFGSRTGALDLDEVLLTETSYESHSRLPAHEHELPSFVFVTSGSFDERYEQRERTCGPGRMLFRPAGERHQQLFLNRGGGCLTIELLSFDRTSALAREDGRLRLEGAPALLGMRIYDEFQRPTTDSPLVVEECVAHLTAVADRRAERPERRPPSWLCTVREAIDANLAQPLRLHRLAEAAQVHRIHLSRTFRRILGCGVAEYVRRSRVHQACARIRTGGEPLSVTAAAVGFSDESHMGRSFREVMGRPPGSYRKAHPRRRPHDGPLGLSAQ